jgi:superfamily II DNA or RNA helicase
VTALPLFPYQERMVQAYFDAWAGRTRPTGTGRKLRLACEVATGGGKTRAGLELLARGLGPRQRGLWIVERNELADQAMRTLLQIDPNASVGIVQGDRDEHHRGVVIASRQTLANPRRRALVRDVGMVVADECHHVVLGGTWETILRHFGCFDSTPTAGLTATLGRADGKELGRVWEEVVARWSIIDGIRGGYLTDIRARRLRVRGLDLRAVRRSGGDLQRDDLGGALHDAKAPSQVADMALEHGEGRGFVAFWPTVATAHEFAAELATRGVAADVVDGTMNRTVRGRAYERSRLHAERSIPHWLVNCMVLTEGFDAPWLRGVLVARPTESPGLFTQMVGRGVRRWQNPFTHEVKTDCLLLDVTGVGSKHRLATIADLTVGGGDPERREAIEQRLAAELDAGDDETLLQLDARRHLIEAEPEPEIPGHVIAQEFDPFATSATLWLSTYGSVPFVSVRDPKGGEHGGSWVIYLWPDGDGLFSVCSVSATGKGATVHERGMPWGYARSHAERLAEMVDPQVSRRAAPWRQKGRPTDRQRDAAAALGIPVGPGTTRGQLSDLISITTATRAIPAGWS